MSQISPSKEMKKKPHPWLLIHYQKKRERTAHLVKTAVDQLVKEKQAVTIEAICRKSIEVDAEGRGVKKSAILENPEAHTYYQQHSTSYQVAQIRRRKARVERQRPTQQTQLLRIDPNRDENRARYRYMQMTKAEIVGRLLNAEQAYAESQEQLAQLQFQLVEQELQRDLETQGKKVAETEIRTGVRQ